MLLATAATALLAAEPDGPIRLRAEWIEPRPLDSAPVLRLRVDPLVPLSDLALVVTTPLDFEVIPSASSATFRPILSTPGRRGLRAEVGAAREAVLDFEVILPPGGHGVLEFVAEGPKPSGGQARGAIGVAAGESPSTGVPRLGAMEFPAAVLPAEGR
jgi:hypothetical protein